MATRIDGAGWMWTISDLADEVSGAKLFIVKMDIEGFEADLFAMGLIDRLLC